MNRIVPPASPQESASPDQRIFVRVVSQVALNISGESIFRTVQERVLKWLFEPERNVRSIPDGAWEGEGFTIDADHSEQVDAIKLNNPLYWGMRLSERLKDPGRIWTTEVGIAAISATEVAFGCRLLCSERGLPNTMPRSIPSFVRGIVFTQATKLDGRLQGADPWIVESEKDAGEFIDFLGAERRRHPVVAFSLPDGADDPSQTIIPVRPFMRRTVGYVHTAIIKPKATLMLTEELGKEFSVYRQAVRTYYPDFDPLNDVSTDHPVATAARIALWDQNNATSFNDFLVHQALRITRPRQELEHFLPPFQQIKRMAAEKAREEARASGYSDAKLLELADEEIAAAKKQAAETLDLLEVAEQEREDALSKAREIQASYIAIQARVEHLEKKLSDAGQKPQSIPETLDGLEVWARDNLSGYVELHDRALKAAQESDFRNVRLVYDALLLMRDHYVPMRRTGGIELKNAFESRLAALGLENTKCFAQKNKAQSYGGDYFVKYQGERRELDWHLKGNNSRDGRHGFRMYYFWDDETSRVVVGYLPGHLETDIT
jgi:hypothetical protein